MEQTLKSVQDAVNLPGVPALVVLVASVILAKVVDFVLCRVLTRLTRHTQTDLDDRLIRLLHRPIFLTFVLLGIYFAVKTLPVPARVPAVVLGVVHTLLVFLWAGSGLKIISAVVDGLSGLADRVSWLDVRTLPLFDNVARLLLIIGAIYCLLVAWNLDVTPVLASAGVAGIAIGFAAKDTLANLFGGLFVIMDSPYKIGDFINLDTGERGRVVKIGLRSTRILTRDDVEITLPNAQIANSTIVNESGGPWEKTRVAISVGVAYGSDVDRVREVLMTAAASIEFVVTDPEPRIRFSEMGDSALIFRVLCWVDEPVLRGQCVDALNTAVYRALNAEGISIPFPQRDVHIKQDMPAGPA